MEKSKKTTLEELMGKPSETVIEETPKKEITEKFELPVKKSNAGVIGIFILLFLLGGVSYYFYTMYAKTQDDTAKTNEQKIVNSAELEEKKKQEEAAAQTPAPAEVTTPETTTKTYYATAETGLNIRASASVSAEVAGSIPYGEKVTFTSDDGTWVGVSFGGVNGFVKKEFLSEAAPPALN